MQIVLDDAKKQRNNNYCFEQINDLNYSSIHGEGLYKILRNRPFIYR